MAFETLVEAWLSAGTDRVMLLPVAELYDESAVAGFESDLSLIPLFCETELDVPCSFPALEPTLLLLHPARTAETAAKHNIRFMHQILPDL